MTSKKVKTKTVFAFFTEQIDELKANGRQGTARNYQRTLSSFSLFRKGGDIQLSACTARLIEQYNDWLIARSTTRNTRSFYMRIFRSVYNKAVRSQGVRQALPFQNVYTGVDRTRKRAISEEVMLQLQKLPLESSSALAMARDIFIFSYATRGMAFVDIAFLCKQNILNETITYTRRKTGQPLSIHIEPCIKQIIDRYQTSTKDSPYVFPLLSSTLPEQAYRQYQTALGYYNRLLKKLGQQISPEVSLSSYTSRHTWATTARNHNIPLSVISAGMGHSSESITQIYLASLENSVIDQANKLMLKVLNG